MTKRHFVALSADGQPVAQRSSARAYVAASPGGGSFSSKPDLHHSLRVVELAKPLEWVATVTFPDGRTETHKSKAQPFAAHYIAACEYVDKASGEVSTGYGGYWRDDLEAFASEGTYRTARILKAGTVTQVLRNWPQA